MVITPFTLGRAPTLYIRMLILLYMYGAPFVGWTNWFLLGFGSPYTSGIIYVFFDIWIFGTQQIARSRTSPTLTQQQQQNKTWKQKNHSQCLLFPY